MVRFNLLEGENTHETRIGKNLAPKEERGGGPAPVIF